MAFTKKVLVAAALLSTLTITACSGGIDGKIIAQKQAPVNMKASFSESKSTQCDRLSCVTIQKASLGKIFLLIASGTTGGSTPQWTDLKPQVVSFERSGGRIALLGQNYTSIYEEIKTVNLIQSFKIVEEDDSSITFNWGGGLKSFISQSAYDIDTAHGLNNDLTDSAVDSIPVTDSFVRNVTFDEQNIELQQISKVTSNTIKISDDKTLSMEPKEETLDMNIQIRSYNLSPNFSKKEYDASRRVGFFVAKIGKKASSTDVTNLITKWDLSPERGPVTVRLSSAIPADYLQAAQEAALYWNKVFGREVVKVETGVDPQAPPKDRTITVHWVTWLDAGAAYAMSQSDPLTGEILRGQVFMPSVFTKVGSADMVQLNGKSPVVGGGKAIACDFTQVLKELAKVSREASDSQRLRLAQDSVRATIAHELGHAFGLRHNFAGSFSAKVSADQIYQSAQTYLKDLNHQGLETSTSIMDYVSGIDNILMAARIKYQPLSYDKMAMDWAYSKDDTALDEKVSKYCTDDDIAVANSQGLNIYGCERFDNGNNPILRKYRDARDEKDNLVNVLFASIIGRMYPGDQLDTVLDLDQVIKDTVKWQKADLSTLGFIGQVLLDSSKNGLPAGTFASLDSVKSGQMTFAKFGMDDTLKKIRAANLKDIGGYATILDTLLRDPQGAIDMNWFDRQIRELVSSGIMAKGTNLSGRAYELTQAQQDKIVKFYDDAAVLNRTIVTKAIQDLLPKLNEDVTQADGSIVKISSILGSGLVDDGQADILAKLALDLNTASAQDVTVKVGVGLATEVKLPKKFLDADTRAQMLKLVSGTGLNFGMDLRRASVRSALAAQVNALLKQIDPSLDLGQLDSKGMGSLSDTLLGKGVVDSDAASWLRDELSTLIALDAIK